MATNYLHVIASDEGLGTTLDGPNTEGLGSRAMDLLRQMFCALHGHDTLLHFEQERISLRCVSCGHETPGWELTETPPTVTIRGDARRLAIARPELISARRVA
jgi:hypothetical protein